MTTTMSIPDLMSAQVSSMDKIWNSKEEDKVWSILQKPNLRGIEEIIFPSVKIKKSRFF